MDLHKCLYRGPNSPPSDDDRLNIFPSNKIPEWHDNPAALRSINLAAQFRAYTLYTEYHHYNLYYLPRKDLPDDWRVDYKNLYKQVVYFYEAEFYQDYLKYKN